MNSSSGGLTIIEALEGQIEHDYSSAFGIVLMTPDDFGYAKKWCGKSRAEGAAKCFAGNWTASVFANGGTHGDRRQGTCGDAVRSARNYPTWLQRLYTGSRTEALPAPS